MGKPWKVYKGNYTLIDLKQRDAFEKEITKIIKEKGKSAVKNIQFGTGEGSKSYRISSASIEKLETGEVEKIKLKVKDTNRGVAELKPGAPVTPRSKLFDKTQELTNKFIERVSGIEGSTPEKIQRYFKENNNALRKLREKVYKENAKLREVWGDDKSQWVSRGHDAPVSKSIDSPRNIFIELLTENIEKGDNYSANPKSSIAIGNPAKAGRSPLENWALDYTTWLNKPENGGDGILAQRGDYNDLLEQKFRSIGDEKWDQLTPDQKIIATNQVDDLIHESEKLNQWLPSEGAERRKFGLLTPDQADQARAWVNDPEFRKRIGKPVVETTELGGRLGGIDHKVHLMKDAVNSGGVIGKKIFKALPFVSVGTGLLLAPSIVNAAEERQEENPSIANWTQLQLERISQKANEVSAAALVPTVIPEPTTTAVGLGTMAVAETVDAVASGGSLMIDAARFIKNNPDKIQEFWTDVKPRLPLHTKEAEEEYKKNKEKDPLGSFAMPF
jgi:hypothetical protein